ncbi:hypothetical protein PDJAM_G00193800, partial [Pangasius djambal]|nr:hypothetical protein [Pangasius djambal]
LEYKLRGRTYVLRHVNRESHLKKVQTLESCSKLDKYTLPRTSEMAQLEALTRRPEVKMAVTMVQHNIPLSFSDHLSPFLRECFPHRLPKDILLPGLRPAS